MFKSRVGRAVLAFILSIPVTWLISFWVSMSFGVGQEFGVGNPCEGAYIIRCSAKTAAVLSGAVALTVAAFKPGKRSEKNTPTR